MRFNLFNLKQRLQERNGKEYSWNEIARRAGLHAHTVRGIAGNDNARVDLDTLRKLLSFFREEGMEISIQDLIVEEENTGEMLPAEMAFAG